VEPIDRELVDIERRLALHRRMEAEAEAADLRAGVERSESFRDFLLDLPVGLIVGVVTMDGAEIWGRVEAVGTDKLRLAETPREPDLRERVRPLRVHDVRIDAVVRLVRDATEWAR
jgi:hypothetical protein